MRSKQFVLFFIVTGLLFAGIAIYFALPKKPTQEHFGSPQAAFNYRRIPDGSNGFASISMGIVSASCFLVAGILLKRNSS